MLTTLFWKKVWSWLKHYWYWPVIIILFIISLVTCGVGGAPQRLFGLLKKSKENHEKELQIIKETTKEKDKKKTEIFTKHAEEIKRIEREHDAELEDIQNRKQEEISKISEKYKDQPDKLAREVAKILSAEYMKNN